MFITHLPEFLARLDLASAAHAIGETAVVCVRQQMLAGYNKPIFSTGALMNDVSFRVQGPSVTIGNTLAYASPIHDGTATQPARPYLSDGILSNIPALQQAAANALQSSPAQ